MYKAVIAMGGTRIVVNAIPKGDLFVVRSNGLRQAGLPEIEISSCPPKLRDVATNLIRQIALNSKDSPESLAEGKTVGGRFAYARQPLIEAFRFTRSDSDASVLCVVDLEDSARRFPHRLVATHLCATAGTSSRDALRLLLVSIEVWPKEKAASNAALGDYEFNPNNFWSWIDIGTALSQAGRHEDAIAHWKTAICMWPRGGKMYAARMIERGSKGWSRSADVFWKSITNELIRSWCVDLGVELTEAALLE